ncbi:MAG: hypothetical protein QM634_06420 [Gordonia sp. (in: high G+C Gram-positive bacteria)]
MSDSVLGVVWLIWLVLFAGSGLIIGSALSRRSLWIMLPATAIFSIVAAMAEGPTAFALPWALYAVMLLRLEHLASIPKVGRPVPPERYTPRNAYEKASDLSPIVIALVRTGNLRASVWALIFLLFFVASGIALMVSADASASAIAVGTALIVTGLALAFRYRPNRLLSRRPYTRRPNGLDVHKHRWFAPRVAEFNRGCVRVRGRTLWSTLDFEVTEIRGAKLKLSDTGLCELLILGRQSYTKRPFAIRSTQPLTGIAMPWCPERPLLVHLEEIQELLGVTIGA